MLEEFYRKNKKTILITLACCLLPVIPGVLLWNRLPEMIATHFDINNQPNGWSSKAFTVFGLPLFLAVAEGICVLICCADPKKGNIAGKMVGLFLWIFPACSFFCSGISLANAVGFEIDTVRIASVFVGLVMIGIGNYLPKCRRNYSMGIRTRWALDDEENWNATHRFGSFVFVIAGILIIPLSYLHSFWVLMGIVFAADAACCLYSFLYYKKKTGKENGCS